eukprot:7186369-Prymnesium_polylepis.1
MWEREARLSPISARKQDARSRPVRASRVSSFFFFGHVPRGIGLEELFASPGFSEKRRGGGS